MTAAVAAPINLCWSGVQARGLRARVKAPVRGSEDQARVADHPGPVGSSRSASASSCPPRAASEGRDGSYEGECREYEDGVFVAGEQLHRDCA
jgi:hypothetical protein